MLYPTSLVKVYLHDIPIFFEHIPAEQLSSFDFVFSHDSPILVGNLKGDILLSTHYLPQITALLSLLQNQRPPKLKSVTVSWDNKDQIKKFLKSRYYYVKAAGGLAVKDGNYLLIYRLKKWDLPKGKLEKGEKILECALREVEEECSVEVNAGPKIGSTWHCYPTKSGWCIKKSTWYMMDCTDDSKMAPQIQEDIEDIAWVAPKNLDKYLKNSYGNIVDVFAKARAKGLIV